MKDVLLATRFRWWHELVLAVLLLTLLLMASQAMPNFLSLKQQLFLSRHLWEFAILALAMTLIIISGGIDLSVGSAMGLCAVAFGICFQRTGSIALSCLASVSAGTLGGLCNGICVTRFKVHPLIITLASYAAFRGIAEGVSQGESYSKFGDAFSGFARSTWLGIPIPGLIFLALAIGISLFLTKTPTGRYIYAIGNNERAARFSGVPVDRIKLSLYTLSGLFAAIATIVYVSRFDTAKADAGKGFELDVITAVVVGGTSIFGGRGTVLGTVLGLILIHETRLFVSRYWRTDELKSIVVGCLLIVSVLVYRAVAARTQDDRTG